MADSTSHIVTVFRNRLRPGAENAYSELAPRISSLAHTMHGFIDEKTFTAPDGERVTIVTFRDRESHNTWRDHPDHREAQRRGVEELYATYSIQVGVVAHTHTFTESE